MKRIVSLSFGAALLAACVLLSCSSLYAQAPARVVASDYGYNAEDSTDALQKAIDSGAKTVVVDKQRGPWIVRTIRLRGELELVLEEGVEILAKQGEFQALGDVLLRADGAKNLTIRGEGKGATLRMRKREYWSEPYRKSEWRHGVSLLSVEHATIENLQIAETGGDGIYLGTSGEKKLPCRDVTIRKVDCVENNRQGISVINVDGLLIEDCVVRDTNGTPPAAGIDFEPNGAEEQISNVVVRRTIAINNVGDGFTFYLPQLRSRGHELSFVIEDCDSVRNAGMGFALSVANGDDMLQSGNMIVRNTRLFGNKIGVAVRSKWAAGASLLFENVTLTTPSADKQSGYAAYKGVSSNPELPEKIDEWTKTTFSTGISLIATGDDKDANGGVTFDRVTIVDADPGAPSDRPLLALRDASADGVGFEKVSGEIESVRVGDSERRFTTTLDAKTIDTLFPHMSARKVAPWNMERLNEASEKALSEELADAWRTRERGAAKPIRLRGLATFYVYAKAGETIDAAFRQRKIGSYEPSPIRGTLVAPDGSTETLEPKVGTDEPYKLTFDAKSDGWYRFDADFGPSVLELASANAPVLTAATPKADVFGSTGRYEFYVPRDAEDLAIRVVGSPTEHVAAKLFDPDGVEVASFPDVDLLAVWTAPVDESGKPKPLRSGFWTLQFDRPETGVLEDYIFSIRGVPALVR